MRIGIITLHCSYNFGSALQAYALQRVLTEMGHEATIIDYRSIDFDHYQLFSLRHPSVTRATLRNLGKFPAMVARRNAFNRFRDRYLKLTAESYHYENPDRLNELQGDFDCFVCGSDQIWNLDMTGGADRAFFLSFAGDKRRVSYAASLGHTSFKPENFDRALVSDLLGKFDCISVREEESLPILQPLVDRKIEVALDPTLLLDENAYAALLSGDERTGDYIFVYMLRESPELISSTIELASLGGKKVLYVCDHDLPIPNGTNLLGVGPDTFLSLVANADCVLTNSFHAMIFSILEETPFRVFAADATASRIRDLLQKLGSPELCSAVACSDPVEAPDWEPLHCRISELREDSLRYLREALS